MIRASYAGVMAAQRSLMNVRYSREADMDECPQVAQAV